MINRVAPRVVQNGEDQNGHPIFVPDVDADTGQQLVDVYVSLEGMGLP